MGTLNDPIARKNALIEQKKKEAAASKAALITTPTPKRENVNPEDAFNKIRIIFDNSGSMASYLKGWDGPTLISEARRGVVEFLRNCNPLKDAVAVHLLNNYARWGDEEESASVSQVITQSHLSSDLVYLASEIDNPEIGPTGGTPLYEKCFEALEASPRATRLVAFSDGQPNNFLNEDKVINYAVELKIPIDTVYFGSSTDQGAFTLQRLAERTGGIFLVFDPAKGVSFADAFKYLSPVKRLMLMNEEFKKNLQSGKVS
jgi:hypothetical protein